MKKKVVTVLFITLAGTLFALYYFAILDSSLRKTVLDSYMPGYIIKYNARSPNAAKLYGLSFSIGIFLSTMSLFWNRQNYKSEQIRVTNRISTPAPAGEGQCGTARWLDKSEFKTSFEHFELDLLPFEQWMKHNLDDIKGKEEGKYLAEVSIENGGVVLGKNDLRKNRELIYFNGDDSHIQVIGATRSGKGRTVVIQSICTIGLSGESLVITDPKGELYCYTSYFLKNLGYEIVTIDFKNPKKSTHYNYLQSIIDSVNAGNIPEAIDFTWDLTAQLVGEAKGEKLWNNGEASIIAASIMAVVYDNRHPENQKYQNLTNVFYFISQMCTPIAVGKAMIVPLNQYMKDLPEEHPSKGLLSVGEIAPSKTRGSFYTSALMTLRLFSSPYIAEMTSKTDYNTADIGNKKMAVFIILPDDRSTYYELATLYVAQQYQFLSKAADQNGGRLEKRVNYILDEFGNFAKISSFMSMMTVGAGKGMRFSIFLQDMAQLDAKYEKENAKTIRGNCDTWIYLKSNDPDLNDLMARKLGKYTISTYSLSSSNQRYVNPSTSNNVSLMARDLLTADEIGRIRRPYTLVTSTNDPAIFYAPDLCSWHFNKILGLGSKKHNQKIMAEREKLRLERTIDAKIALWGIWNEYKSSIQREQEETQKKNFEDAVIKQMMESGGLF
ncbi:VirD4-like conjugal transfer protein, CD1115 family [Anaeromicropila populeti]|uniref:Type IV secretion system protein VirD4 n=1 Tax=Anaeromicropila populeti TaxID=37658 RepID=A0A1I6JF57_9FIRM|nr:type IV secretory system conjugative DNA transfer family protein [Anaeromicropila populeti]SFR77572.1 type IV secretion system protein VirD4 [Anaeromicropila populeti]